MCLLINLMTNTHILGLQRAKPQTRYVEMSCQNPKTKNQTSCRFLNQWFKYNNVKSLKSKSQVLWSEN